MPRTPAEQVRAVLANLEQLNIMLAARRDRARAALKHYVVDDTNMLIEQNAQAIQLIKTECAELLS